jgi:hypothetical protein
MYYDRTLPRKLRELARSGGPLEWLVRWVQAEPATRLAFRRNRGSARKHGALQVYVGRTSPLELQWRKGGGIKLSAHAKYRKVSPSLFSNKSPVSSLAALEPHLQQHLQDCRASMPEAFTKGEAVVHNRMMRRYSLQHENLDPVVAVDCEVRIGFGSKAEQEAYIGTARRDSGRSRPRSPLGKLDAIGVLRDGDVALIEVKKEEGSLVTAARQVENHVYNFTRLLAEGHDLPGMLDLMVAQKTSLGLASEGAPRASSTPCLVPIIAAPDNRADWAAHWSSRVQPVIDASQYLGGVRFWRLSDDGEVLEEQQP